MRELTKADFVRMRPATEVVAEIVVARRRSRGRPAKAVTMKQVTLRLSLEVLAYFRRQGRGWQTRLDEVLTRYVRRKAVQRVGSPRSPRNALTPSPATRVADGAAIAPTLLT